MMVSGGLEETRKDAGEVSKIVVLTMKTSVFDGGWFYRVNFTIVIHIKDVSINDMNDFTE